MKRVGELFSFTVALLFSPIPAEDTKLGFGERGHERVLLHRSDEDELQRHQQQLRHALMGKEKQEETFAPDDVADCASGP